MAWDIGAIQSGGADIGPIYAGAPAGPQTLEPDGLGPLLDLTDGPTLAQPDVLVPAALGPLLSFSGPSLAQDETIGLTGLGPLMTLGEQTLQGAPQTMFQVGIGPMLTFGEPRIAEVQTLPLSGGIGPLMSFGDPTLVPVGQRMAVNGIGPMLRFGEPQLNGGVSSLQVFIGNYERTEYTLYARSFIRSQTLGRWTGTIEFLNVPGPIPRAEDIATLDEWFPQRGQTVQIKENGRVLFRGCISETARERFMGTDFVTSTCQIADKAHRFDRRVVPRKTFAADLDAADVVRSVLADYGNNEGISDTGVPASMGALGADLIVNFWYVSQVFDEITRRTGYEWYVDNENSSLVFVEPGTAVDAPFDITEESRNYRNLKVVESTLDYRNRQYVVSNRTILPGDGDGSGVESIARTETYTMEDFNALDPSFPDSPVGYQVQAWEHGFGPYAVWLDFPIAQVLRVRRNSGSGFVEEPVFEDGEEAMAYIEAHPSDQIWGYFSGAAWIGPRFYMEPGDIVEVQYVAQGSSATVENGDLLVVEPPPDAPEGEQFGTCGSGLYEHVEQVNDVETQDDLDAIAAALIERSGVIPHRVTYETDHPGIAPGMKQSITDERLLGPDPVDVFITGVVGKIEGPDLGHGTSFRWTVTAFNLPDPGNWKTWMNRLLARTRHPSPILKTYPITFVIAPDSSLAAGVSFTNPMPADVTGQLVEIAVVFDGPPEDQDLELDITVNGVSILAEPIVVEDGDDTLQKITTFALPVIYIFLDDIVRIDARYRVLGSNPVAASNGTVTMRIKE